MKYLLLLSLLLHSAYGLSIETDSAHALHESDIDELMKMDVELEDQAEKSIKIIQEKQIQHTQKEKEPILQTQTREKTPFFLLGLGAGSGGGNSILANASQEKNDPYSSKNFLLRFGIIFTNLDLYLQYNVINFNADESDLSLSNNSLESHIKYRIFNFDFEKKHFKLSPFIGLAFGLNTLDTTPDSTFGLNYKLSTGAQFFMLQHFMAELALTYNSIYWDYPIDGITNTFQGGDIEINIEYRF